MASRKCKACGSYAIGPTHSCSPSDDSDHAPGYPSRGLSLWEVAVPGMPHSIERAPDSLEAACRAAERAEGPEVVLVRRMPAGLWERVALVALEIVTGN
ncbi:MAG: hypothetical protein L3J73_04380 [Thermoplasmata archaeon]|nr:hypothetical protein [Thermoplasmata archaeon]